MEDFDYVVPMFVMPKLCFGSTIHRQVLPVSGPAVSPFMRRVLPHKFIVGPGSHNVSYFRKTSHPIIKQTTSQRGYGKLASSVPRFIGNKISSSPLCYDFYKKPLKKSYQPFEISMSRSKEYESFAPP